MTTLICVECGESTDSLYVEFSQGNIRLTRCDQCGAVTDRYIEYDLILVSIDVVLHRIQAYRHLLHNRQEFETSTWIRWLVLSVVGVNAGLKLSVLHHTIYQEIFTAGTLLHLLSSCVVEHVAFILTALVVLWMFPNSRHLINGHSKLLRKIYVSLTFPEIFKFIAVVLQIFDSESTLLQLIGALIISMQLTALQSVINVPFNRLILIMAAAEGMRLSMRFLFFSVPDVLLLGVII